MARRVLKPSEIKYEHDGNYVVKNCVTCGMWCDKTQQMGATWSGAYTGQCRVFRMETPPLHSCRQWVKKDKVDKQK